MRQRGSKGGRSLDLQALRALVQKMVPMTTALGVVRKFPGESSHYEIVIDSETGNREVMVDVELIPNSEKVFCRLGFGQEGVYRIPRVDQEVAVMIPGSRNSLIADELDFDPIIVAILDTDVPSELDDDTTVVVLADKVVIKSDDIRLGGANPATLDHVVVGSGIDTFSGQTYFALGATTSKVKAEKS